MEKILYPGVVLLLWAAALWLLLRDVEAHGLGETTPPERHKRIVWIYAAIMLAITEGAALMFLTLYRDVDPWTAVKRLALLNVLWPIGLTDLKTYRIPNAFILFGLICRVLIFPFELFFSEPGIWQILLTEAVAAGALLLAALLCALVIKNSIGFGDMKLFLVMGLLLGTQGIWGPIFLSLLVIFGIAVFMLATKRKTRKDVLPFGPALVIGTYLAVFLTGM